jgi:uncharacterized protein YbaR (Trm112 family)
MMEKKPTCPWCSTDLIRVVNGAERPYIYKEFSGPNTMVSHCLNCKVILPAELDALLGPMWSKETAILICPTCKHPLVTRTEGEERPRVWYYHRFTAEDPDHGLICSHCKGHLPLLLGVFLPFDGVMGPSDVEMHNDGMCPPTDYKIMEGWIDEFYAHNPQPNAEEVRKFREALHERLQAHLEAKYGRRTA